MQPEVNSGPPGQDKSNYFLSTENVPKLGKKKEHGETNNYSLREAAKKKVHPLVAGPLRGGGGKGQAIKEKKNFFGNFFFCHLNIKIILL